MNPRPQGFEYTLVHVRSRRIPGDWVRGFGRDLFLTFYRSPYRGRPRENQPWWLTISGYQDDLPSDRLHGFLGRESDCVVVRKCTSRLMRRSRSRQHADIFSVPTSKPIAPSW